MKKSVLLSAFLFFIAYLSIAQNVGIGTTLPHSSAALEVKATNKGLLIPRITTAQRNSIASPAKGLMVYDSSRNNYWYYTGNTWKEIAGSDFKTDSNLIVGQQSGIIPSYNMTPASQVSDSSGYLYDSGGPGGNYGNNESYEFQIVDNFDNDLPIDVRIISLNTETSYDTLSIYEFNSNRRFVFSGTTTTKIRLYGPIAIVFQSNSVNTQAGFQIRWDKIFTSASPGVYDSTQLSGWYFNSSKMYMRGGINNYNNWSPDSSGQYSFAYGKAIQAKGYGGVALGLNTAANGDYGATALGYKTTANGDLGATALGYSTSASGDFGSIALGYGSSSQGNFGSVAMGYGCLASGDGSVSIGALSAATNDYSIAIGTNTSATGLYSTTMGYYTQARGISSTSTGDRTIATGYASLATGTYNDTIVSAQASVSASTPALMVGNGSFVQRSNAFLVMRTGRVHIDPQSKNNGNLDSNAILFGTYNSTGEGISSKRTVGGNQYGLDFYTNTFKQLSITNAGTVQVTNNLTVQNGKGIIRNTDATQSKKLSASVTVNTSFAAGETKTFTVTWPETFSASPEAFVGNVTSGAGGWAEVVMTLSATSTAGATLYVYNPKTSAVNPNFTIKVIAIGAQ